MAKHLTNGVTVGSRSVGLAIGRGGFRKVGAETFANNVRRSLPKAPRASIVPTLVMFAGLGLAIGSAFALWLLI